MNEVELLMRSICKNGGGNYNTPEAFSEDFILLFVLRGRKNSIQVWKDFRQEGVKQEAVLLPQKISSIRTSL